MQQHPRSAYYPEPDKNWLTAVYAAVLYKMLDDLGRTGSSHQVTAIQWFSEDLSEVAIICGICQLIPRNRLTPAKLYLEVARRLRQKKIRCPAITIIRWHLRHGDNLWQIRVSVEEVEQAKAA